MPVGLIFVTFHRSEGEFSDGKLIYTVVFVHQGDYST